MSTTTTGPARIHGRKLSLEFDGEEFWCNFSRAVLDNEEDEDGNVTFCDAAEGGARRFFFDLEAVQSTAPASFWRMCWERSGELIPFTFAPHGNETATAEEPHFVGSVTIGPRPAVGGEAGARQYMFETRWDVEGTPVLDDGTP